MAKNMEGYTLYYMVHCPFCTKVLSYIEKLGLMVDLKNTSDPQNKKELQAGGGKSMVPCLRHPDGKWQYESGDIIEFLRKNFS